MSMYDVHPKPKCMLHGCPSSPLLIACIQGAASTTSAAPSAGITCGCSAAIMSMPRIAIDLAAPQLQICSVCAARNPGSVYPLEMHIVHFVKSDQLPACGHAGCPVVLGIMIALTDDESLVSPTLRRIITAMPLNEGTNNTIEGTISVDSLLPQTRTYFTYEVTQQRTITVLLMVIAWAAS
eukprot:GHRQ01017085.1.p1 GENE.GHRQ01017085.1~~GHRQ01017085.1.p1  ORF type:complete len:181 (+),score=24.22 GHRQ01017085.1:266-808(+)